ncbi:hypothetical protein Tco_0950147, partial [Tanacetum coccineum]
MPALTEDHNGKKENNAYPRSLILCIQDVQNTVPNELIHHIRGAQYVVPNRSDTPYPIGPIRRIQE